MTAAAASDGNPPDSYATRLFPGRLADVRLPAPSPRQAAAYRARVRAWLTRAHASPPTSEPHCVQSTTKSAVFRAAVGDGYRAVKVFDHTHAFLRELLNARLLRHDPSFVRLLAWSRTDQVMEYEWLPEVGLPDRPEEYLRHLARVHTAAYRLPSAAVPVVRAAAHHTEGRDGSERPGCAVLDLKPGHCGRRADGSRLVQLDLESLVFGVDVLMDVAGAAAMLGLTRDRARWRDGLRAYQEESRSHGVDWRWAQLAAALPGLTPAPPSPSRAAAHRPNVGTAHDR